MKSNLAPLRVLPVKRSPRPSGPLGVVDQVRLAFRPQARLATLLGCLLGGFVPLASYVVAHQEIDFSGPPLSAALAVLLVAGGLLFSAKSVYGWSRLAFQSGGKALGFVVLTEGVMIVSRTAWLGLAALGILIGINAISAGCTLSLRKNSLSPSV
jgi:hypothetical protein